MDVVARIGVHDGSQAVADEVKPLAIARSQLKVERFAEVFALPASLVDRRNCR